VAVSAPVVPVAEPQTPPGGGSTEQQQEDRQEGPPAQTAPATNLNSAKAEAKLVRGCLKSPANAKFKERGTGFMPSSPEAEVSTYSTEFDGGQDFQIPSYISPLARTPLVSDPLVVKTF
jgi:hypothetical protein